MKAVRLGVKFEHGVQMIVRGLKTARGFERQKLSRREKTARSENSENTRMTLLKLAEEIEALKVWMDCPAAVFLLRDLKIPPLANFLFVH